MKGNLLFLDRQDNSYHLVMELVPGMDLFTLLQQQGPLGPQIACLGRDQQPMGAEDGMKTVELPGSFRGHS